MRIHVCGLSFRTAAVGIREKLAFDRSEYGDILKQILSLPDVCGCSLITTCNRVEVYIHAETDGFESDVVVRIICNSRGVDYLTVWRLFYFYSGSRAVRHIFRVACGLDSMVLGEDQILGQMKDAYATSMEAGTTSAILNTLIRQAVTSAKKIKTQTDRVVDSASVAGLAVKYMLETQDNSLEGKSVLLIGMGRTGTLVLKELFHSNIGKVYITRRAYSTAAAFDECREKVHVIDYADRYTVLDECDMVVSATASPHYTVTAEMVEQWVTDRTRKRIFLDLAVPRDIEQEVGKLPFARYCDIDGLRSVADLDADARLMSISLMESIIDDDVQEFEKWYRYREALPVADELRIQAEGMLRDKLAALMDRLQNIHEEEKKLIKASMKDMVDEILDRLIYHSRERVDKDDMRKYFSYLAETMKD
jgi:glutamyl-tRNA reductase